MFQFITKYITINDISKSDYKPFYYSKKSILQFLLSFAQLAGLFYTIKYFDIEKRSGIGDFYLIILIAFLLNSILHLKYKLFLFTIVSIVILIKAFGIVIAFSFVMIGLTIIFCSLLKINFRWKIFFILIITTFLIALKSQIYVSLNWTIMATFISSMFMFRIILFLYEVKHGLQPKSIIQSIAYFFMFPNLFFLFFPIVDYKVFIKTYYDKHEHEMWQKGIRWMLRGIIHIFTYRILCAYFLISPSEIKDVTSLLIYLVVNYALILRISGVFHLVIGLLCMFGMNLPQTFNNYFLATSFVDLWRRINIYWREFILKIFFYPIMFRLKKYLTKKLLPVTMMITFFITWFLHCYQLFWITGVISIKWIDLIFWLTVGICITANAVTIQNKLIKNKPSKIKPHTIPFYFITILKIQGMLLVMSILWMFWNSQSITDWFYFISLSSVFSAYQLVLILATFISITLIGVLIQVLLRNNKVKGIITKAPEKTFWLTSSSIILLSLFTLYNPNNKQTKKFKAALSNVSPNKNEKIVAEKNYYSGLMEGYDEKQGFGLGDKRLKKLFLKKQKNFYEYSDDLLIKKIKKNISYTDYGYLFTSNQYGMRDKQYSLVKPKNTFRIALLGGSYEMGSGVSDKNVFEAIVEDKINKNKIFNNYENFEILNFAVGGYYLIQHLKLSKEEIYKFKPDALIYFAHSNEKEYLGKNFAMIIKNHKDLESPFLKSISSKLKLNSFMSEFEIIEKLIPYSDSLVFWSYKKIAEDCKKNNCVPIWAYLLTLCDKFDQEEFNSIKGYAEKLGFITLDLSDPYKTDKYIDIQVSDLDSHPNAKGQSQIADCFYNQLMFKKDSILLRSALIKNGKTN